MRSSVPASLVPLDIEELMDSVVSGLFRLVPVLLCVRAAADSDELHKEKEGFTRLDPIFHLNKED